MIRHVYSDIFQSRRQTLVNPVNCVGVMGGGLALQFKRRFPRMDLLYQEACSENLLRMGRPWLWTPESGQQVLCFPTKHHWKDDSTIAGVTFGLEWLEANAKGLGITSLAVPRLGCGLGGLRWEDVRPIMDHSLSKLGIPVDIHVHGQDWRFDV